jgi:hypothetical protein
MSASGGRPGVPIPPWFYTRFPKTRPSLPDAYRAIFIAEYRRNRGIGRPRGAKERLESWMHRQIAKSGGPRGPILELGAGGLNHLPWEPSGEAYDIVEPFAELYAGQSELPRIRRVYRSIEEIPRAHSYRRIISIATLEHVLDLPALVARSVLLLTPDGTFASGIPSEGGLLWYLAWRFGTGPSFWWRTRLDYGVLMRHEHVNTADEILEVAGRFFDTVAVRRFPTPWHHGSLYAAFEGTGPRVDAAASFLQESTMRRRA